MSEYSQPDLLIEGEWLEQHLRDANLRVVDCDSREAYRRAHIPGAVFPSDTFLKNPDDRRYVMTPEQFAAEMQSLGIGDDTLIIAYDQGSNTAGRMWWALNYYGHRDVKVLNGGWNQWLAEGRPITLEVPQVGATSAFTPRPDESLRATAEYIMERLDDPNVVIWDVRSEAEWNGTNTRGNKRQGHMPGAVHLEWVHNLTEDELKRWKPAGELKQQLAACGITPEKEVITV